jgi:hypothetical protein
VAVFLAVKAGLMQHIQRFSKDTYGATIGKTAQLSFKPNPDHDFIIENRSFIIGFLMFIIENGSFIIK